VTIFLDTSVLLAACGSATGSSRALFALAPRQGWTLMSSFYAANEVEKNLHVFPASGTAQWLRLKRLLLLVDDVLTIDRPTIFTAGKDRPILSPHWLMPRCFSPWIAGIFEIS